MFRPKLDARSYLNLILVVIAALLALNLVAQQPQTRMAYTPEAEAGVRIAESVTQVAQANQQIAAALQDVAKAIGGAGDSISGAIRDGARASAGAPSYGASSGSTTGAPAYQGSIEVNQ